MKKLKIPNRINFRLRTERLKTQLEFILDFHQFASVSEAVRQAIEKYADSLRISGEKQKELEKEAGKYGLTVQPEYVRGGKKKWK